ncbi:MAG: type II toxin-antitoxin system VapC family toxin [Mycobacteriales bacterium]
MIVCDASGLYAAYDANEKDHATVVAVLDNTDEKLLLSPFVLAELDYLLLHRLGPVAEQDLLGDVAAGVYQLEPFGGNDVQAAQSYIEQYADLNIGLADASNAIIAKRHRTIQILTLDERHFRAITPLTHDPAFTLLPTDSPSS